MGFLSYLCIGIGVLLVDTVLDRVFLSREERVQQAEETKEWFCDEICPYFGVKPDGLDYVLLYVVLAVFSLCLWPLIPFIWMFKYNK